MIEIGNTPRAYPWGSRTAIAEIRGAVPSGNPEAELWLGDHPECPSVVKDSGETLIEWGATHQADMGGNSLPFLMKLLAAESPLSIQAHPTRERARRRFDDENDAGIPLDSPSRNYRDRNHKPEIIIALTDFSALCGFRPAADRTRIIDSLADRNVVGAADLRRQHTTGLDSTVEWALTRGDGVEPLVAAIADGIAPCGDSVVDDAMATAQKLATHFPADPGVVVSLLVNHVRLKPGEALFLPAGNIHAYLHGVGVEVMAASDNVLRGGLTSKHVDVPELLSVLDFRELVEPRLTPVTHGSVSTFDPGIDDFAVTEVRVSGETSIAITGPAIALVCDGSVEVHTDHALRLERGNAVFIGAQETVTTLGGEGHIFFAHLPARD